MLHIDGPDVRISIPVSTLPFRETRMLAAVVVGEWVVLMDASLIIGVDVACLDRASGALLWSAELGPTTDRSFSGSPPLDISLPIVVGSRDALHFFGLTPFGAYAVSRNAATGRQEFYFATTPLCGLRSHRVLFGPR